MKKLKEKFFNLLETKYMLRARRPLLKLYYFIRYALMIPRRLKIVSGYLLPNTRLAIRWLFDSREIDNFTYDLTSLNKEYLVNVVNVVTGVDRIRIEKYIRELEDNTGLRNHINYFMSKDTERYHLGPLEGYGRRLGWYAFVRALKPRVVMETGVDWGLGSCVITEALMRNAAEGAEGKYFGTDIRPEAGALFIGKYRKYGEILYGDSIKTLRKFKRRIDIFINDSDHSPIYEAKEYATINRLLKRDSLILGDNSHCSAALSKFAVRTKRKFIFFAESPAEHWYPGAGIGIAYT